MTKPPATATLGAEIALRPHPDGPIRPIEGERPGRFASVVGLSTALHAATLLVVLIAIGPPQLASATQEPDAIAVDLFAADDVGAEQEKTTPGVPPSARAEQIDPIMPEQTDPAPRSHATDKPPGPPPEPDERAPSPLPINREKTANPEKTLARSTEPASRTKAQLPEIAKTSRKTKTEARPDAKAKRGKEPATPKGAQGTGSSGERPDRIGGPSSSAVAAYRGKIQARVQSAAARSGVGAPGKVVVSLTIASNGSASDIRLVRTSGNPVLDRIALAAVRRASPFPPIPREAGRARWAFTVPLVFGTR
ncbi:energy transducer TonB [Nordella sp. HKS 07]|uniref:energy transducer TonB n=1 Tax=Nordella sp. HKS 07 TaxID=2712222 RepID=UPI001FEF51E0|nr:TonB family protein [Nordella sp. HKS 07]